MKINYQKKNVDSFVAETGKDLYINGIIVISINKWTAELDNCDLIICDKSHCITGLIK